MLTARTLRQAAERCRTVAPNYDAPRAVAMLDLSDQLIARAREMERRDAEAAGNRWE